MKTLVIASYSNERERQYFREYFSDVLSRDDVIFIADPDNVSDLQEKMKPYEGKYDRVVLATHGMSDRIPFMEIGTDEIAIHDVVYKINRANDGSVKKIHLTSCMIGTNFEEIKKSGGFYHQGIKRYLKLGQSLFLHGDSFTGDVRGSLGGRLKGIVENKDYSIAENILDSDEAINVVVKKSGNLRGSAEYLTSFSQPVFDCTSFNCGNGSKSTDALRLFLSEAINKADSFESNPRTYFTSKAQQRFEDYDEEYFRQYLANRSTRNIQKLLDVNKYEIIESIPAANFHLMNKNGYTGLMVALSYSREDFVLKIIESKDVDVNAVDEDGWTPFMRALNDKQEAITLKMLENGADVNAAFPDGLTPLVWAMNNGQEAIALKMLENGADVNVVFSSGFTPLLWAIRNGQEAIALKMLENGADVNAVDKDGFTPLVWAINNGQEAIALKMLENGADVNAVDKDGWTPFMRALKDKQEAITLKMLENGADVNAAFPDGLTPLVWAINNGLESIALKIIESNDADVNAVDKDGWTPFVRALRNKREAVVLKMLENGADVNVVDKNGCTALILAIDNKLESAASKIIDHPGVDINATDKSTGNTPLMLAIYSNLESIALKIIESNDADVNAVDKDGWTPFVRALRNKREAVVLKMLENGADVNAAFPDGLTPLMFASKNGLKSVVLKILEDPKVDLNISNSGGRNALMFAATYLRDDVEIIELLLAKGADPEAKDNYGGSALDYTSPEISKLISQAIEKKHLEKEHLEKLGEALSAKESEEILGRVNIFGNGSVEELLKIESSEVALNKKSGADAAEHFEAFMADRSEAVLGAESDASAFKEHQTSMVEASNKISYNPKNLGLRGSEISDDEVTATELGMVFSAPLLLIAAYLCSKLPSGKVKVQESKIMSSMKEAKTH